jgi:NitT/TauT family transport system substrate-binding protein
MSLQSVNVLDVRPAHWLEAISSGEVDAIVVSQIYVNQVQALLAGGVTIWPVQSNQDAFGLVYGQTDWVTHHADLVRRFLMSLAQAEAYSIDHPVEARAIIQKRLDLDTAYLASDWPRHRFSLSLDESLVAAMEDEARWMIENNLTTEKQVPDFLDYIYMSGLQTVIPDAFNIIH